jgi:hypothetical protein
MQSPREPNEEEYNVRWIVALVTTLAFVGSYVTEGKAQTITITGVAAAKGSITLSGKATVPANWKIDTVETFAKPPKGAAGQGGYALSPPKADGSYGGAPMTVPPATYDCYALLTATDPNGKQRYFYSQTQSVNATGGSSPSKVARFRFSGGFDGRVQLYSPRNPQRAILARHHRTLRRQRSCCSVATSKSVPEG